MAAPMIRTVVVRNTFLNVEEDADHQLLGCAPMRRSKSVGDDPEVAAEVEIEAAPKDADVPPAAAVAVHSEEATCCGLPKVTSNASVSTMVPEDADAARGLAGFPLRNVDSSNSINSMLSDWAGPSLRNVGSSGSVSSMVSEVARAEDGAGEARVDQLAPAVASAGGQATAPRRGRGRQVLSSPPAPKDYCHGQVPKRCDLAKEFAHAAQQGPPTTMMIRNIPNHFT
ncbi:unnamed protein product, partial [Prorocentrum cordatum]